MHEPLWNWFDQMPIICQEKLARIIWLLITEDISDMALPSRQILHKFKMYFSSEDLPIRKAAKISILIFLLDTIMQNLPVFLEISKNVFRDDELERKLIHIEERMWKRIRTSWNKMKNTYYSSDLISLALSEFENRRMS